MAPSPSGSKEASTAPSSTATAISQQGPPTTEPEESKYHGTPNWLHNSAILIAVLGPIGLLLPGRGRRKSILPGFSLQNAVLGGASFWGVNQLAHDFTGKSIWARSNERWASVLTPLDPLPDKAKANKLLMDKEREARRRAESAPTVAAPTAAVATAATAPGLISEKKSQAQSKPAEAKRGWVESLWMGNEKEGWRERRKDEDRKALESGTSIGEMMMEQISDAWNQLRGNKRQEKIDPGQQQSKDAGRSDKKP
jgi:hypothetical protein